MRSASRTQRAIADSGTKKVSPRMQGPFAGEHGHALLDHLPLGVGLAGRVRLRVGSTSGV